MNGSLGNGRLTVKVVGIAIVAALAFDGFLCAILAVLFLPLHAGSVPVPISALIAGAVNVMLVRVAKSAGHSVGQAALPLGGFFLGLLLCSLGGPGGDVLIPGDWRGILLLVVGLLPPAVVLYRMNAKAGAHEPVRSS